MAKRKTHDEYVAELAVKNPGVTVLGEYVSAHTKVEHRCGCGASWFAAPRKVLYGQHCSACRNEKSKKSHADYAAQVDALNKGITVVGEYAGFRTKTTHRCAEGHEWDAQPSSILSGSGCPYCAGMAKKTHAEYVAELAGKRPDVKVVGEYVNAMTKIEHKCPSCEGAWFVMPSSLLGGHSKTCSACGNERRGRERRKSHAQYVRELATARPGWRVLERYQNCMTKIKHVCDKGHHIEMLPNDVISRYGCKHCCGNVPEDYTAFLKRERPTIVALEEYKTATKKIFHQCQCGHKWKARPNDIKSGYGCGRCAGNVMSESYDEYLQKDSRGFHLLEHYKTRHEKIWHGCSLGHAFKATPGNVKRGRGCPFCDRTGTDADLFYIWQNEADGAYKIGITSQRIKHCRITRCAKLNNMTPRIIMMLKTPHARDIERRALELGDNVNYPDTIDGYTEFRRYSDAELGEVWRMAVGA